MAYFASVDGSNSILLTYLWPLKCHEHFPSTLMLMCELGLDIGALTVTVSVSFNI